MTRDQFSGLSQRSNLTIETSVAATSRGRVPRGRVRWRSGNANANAAEGNRPMASFDFLPKRDAELVTWSTNFLAGIQTMATSVGLTAAQATAYGTLHDNFVTSYNASASDATNSRSAIVTKNECRALLVANAR